MHVIQLKQLIFYTDHCLCTLCIYALFRTNLSRHLDRHLFGMAQKVNFVQDDMCKATSFSVAAKKLLDSSQPLQIQRVVDQVYS